MDLLAQDMLNQDWLDSFIQLPVDKATDTEFGNLSLMFGQEALTSNSGPGAYTPVAGVPDAVFVDADKRQHTTTATNISTPSFLTHVNSFDYDNQPSKANQWLEETTNLSDFIPLPKPQALILKEIREECMQIEMQEWFVRPQQDTSNEMMSNLEVLGTPISEERPSIPSRSRTSESETSHSHSSPSTPVIQPSGKKKYIKCRNRQEAEERKKCQNRAAAEKYRAKKRMERALYESEEAHLTRKNRSLKSQIEDVQYEIRYLRQLMNDLNETQP